MFAIQGTKIINAIPPAAIKDDAAFVSNVIDLNDFDGCGYIEFVVNLGSIDATMATLKVMESDTKTDATTLGGVPVEVKDVTTKPGNSDSGKVAVIGVDCRGARERYLQLEAAAGDGAAGTYLSAIAIAQGGTLDSQASERGLLFAEYA